MNRIIPASESPCGLPILPGGVIVGLGDPRLLERIARKMPATDRGCWRCSRTFDGHTASTGIVVKGKRVTLHTRCYSSWRRVQRHITQTGCASCWMGFECDEAMVA